MKPKATEPILDEDGLPVGSLTAFGMALRELAILVFRPVMPLLDWLEHALSVIAARIKRHI